MWSCLLFSQITVSVVVHIGSCLVLCLFVASEMNQLAWPWGRGLPTHIYPPSLCRESIKLARLSICNLPCPLVNGGIHLVIGTLCENEIDWCQGNQCVHGSCVSGTVGYDCNCVKGEKTLKNPEWFSRSRDIPSFIPFTDWSDFKPCILPYMR